MNIYTKRGKKRFVRDLSHTIVQEIEKLIDAGKIPDAWDGHELRCLLANRFEDSASMSRLRREPRSARAHSFKNHLLITPGL